jgi:hypothetical protein
MIPACDIEKERDRLIEIEEKQLENDEIESEKETEWKQNMSDVHYCKLCKITCYSSYCYEKHLNGKKHRDIVKKQQELAEDVQEPPSIPLSSSSTSNSKQCNVCHKYVGKHNYSRHVKNHDKHPKKLFCNVCQSNFTTHSAYLSNCRSRKHTMKVSDDRNDLPHEFNSGELNNMKNLEFSDNENIAKSTGTLFLVKFYSACK